MENNHVGKTSVDRLRIQALRSCMSGQFMPRYRPTACHGAIRFSGSRLVSFTLAELREVLSMPIVVVCFLLFGTRFVAGGATARSVMFFRRLDMCRMEFLATCGEPDLLYLMLARRASPLKRDTYTKREVARPKPTSCARLLPNSRIGDPPRRWPHRRRVPLVPLPPRAM